MPKFSANRATLLLGLLLLLLNILRLVSTLRLRVKITTNVFAYDTQGSPRELPLNFDNAVMVFEDDNLLDIYAADTWYSAIPSGNGWAILGPNKTAFSVSMYHQLHCLNSMRYDLITSRLGKRPSQETLDHANHCYNYLRQGLLCKSDVTLEPTQQVVLNDGKIGAAASGSGVAHICRDWTKIRRYMEDNFRDNADYEFWSPKLNTS